MEHFNFRVERSGASPVLFEFGYDVSRKKFYPRVFDAEMLWKKVFSGEFVNGTLKFDGMRFVPHPSLGPVYSEKDQKFYLSQYGMNIKEIIPTNAENECIVLTAEHRDDFTQVPSLVRPIRNHHRDVDVDKDFFMIDILVETFSSDRKVLIDRKIYQSSIADWKKNIELEHLQGGSHAYLISTSRGIRVNIPIKMSSFDASDDPFTL